MLDLVAAHESQAVAKALADLWGHGVVTGAHYKEAEAAIKASRESLAAAGLVIVPREATEEMCSHFVESGDASDELVVRQLWASMVEVARGPMQAKSNA